MARTTSLVAARIVEIMRSQSNGLNSALAAITESDGIAPFALTGQHLRLHNIAPELSDQSVAAKYPVVHIYCEKLSNLMREKFRTFSGKARMVVEARVSQDRLENLEQRTELMVSAITSVLDASRGDWGSGMLFNGGYEVLYGPVKRGGRNFLQLTRVVFDVDISAN